MFAISTVKTLVESQLEAEHPLRGIRTTMRQVLRESLPRVRTDTTAKKLDIPRRDFFAASLWRALHSIRNESMLKDSLRFDLRAQWFVGFCLQPGEWPHAAYTEALDLYLPTKSAQTFFAKMLTHLREEGLHRSEYLALNLELLEGWADPSCLLPSDGVELPSRSGRKKVRDWGLFEGRRTSRGLPGQSYRTGTHPTSTLGGQVGTTRALANAQLGPLTLQEIENAGGPTPAYVTSSHVPVPRAPSRAQSRASSQLQNRTQSRTQSRVQAKTDEDYDPKALMESLITEICG